MKCEKCGESIDDSTLTDPRRHTVAETEARAAAIARHPASQVQPLGGSIRPSPSSPWGSAR